MKRTNRYLIPLLALMVSSCAKETAKIFCTVSDAPSDSVIVKLLDVNTFVELDTVATDESGSFVYEVEIQDGAPEFVYLFHGEDKIASLLLEKGDRVEVSTDTKGKSSITGSEESNLLTKVERDFSAFLGKFAATANELSYDNLSTDREKEIRASLSRQYVSYYREAVAHILTHPNSLTSIPVLYQKISEDFPVFGQITDAVHFRTVCDSLKLKYPDSRYVKALDKEASRRENILSLQVKVDNAAVMSYPDLNLPNEKGEKVAISSLDAKVILIHFWDSSEASDKLFNMDVLKPLYDRYHSKGLEIYSICLDRDKAVWASVVKSQNLQWVNVNDGLGGTSPAVLLYGVDTLPASFIIIDGSMYGDPISNEAQLRNLLDRQLK